MYFFLTVLYHYTRSNDFEVQESLRSTITFKMTEKKSQTTSSEKQIPTALDKCIADGIIKVGKVISAT